MGLSLVSFGLLSFNEVVFFIPSAVLVAASITPVIGFTNKPANP